MLGEVSSRSVRSAGELPQGAGVAEAVPAAESGGLRGGVRRSAAGPAASHRQETIQVRTPYILSTLANNNTHFHTI